MPHALSRLAALALLAIAGCTSFATIDRDVCGNGLLEAGEDCDTTDARCVACRVTCSTASDCPTAAYACGVDGTCHAPGGRFASGRSPQPFAIDDLAITDLDRDGIGDVLGVSKTAIQVRYGDTTGNLAGADDLSTPIQGGVAAIADLDGDGARDVAFGTSDGVVAYTSPYGQLAPLDGRQTVGLGGLSLATMFTIDPNVFGLVAAHPGPVSTLELVIGSTVSRGQPIGATDAGSPVKFCGGALTATNFEPQRIDVYVASDVTFAMEAVVVVSGQTAAGATRVCVTDLQVNLVTQQVAFTEITPPVLQTNPTAARAVLARLDGDAANPCPSLAIADFGATAGARLVTFAGSFAGGHCTLAATPAPLGFTTDFSSQPSPLSVAVGHVPLSPAPLLPSEPFASWGRDAVVTSDGVFGVMTTGGAPSKLARLYFATRTIDRARVGDFDGDGAPDLATTTEGENDVDILYRTSYSFAPYRVTTATRPVALVVGDFDGNTISDVAYAEPIEGHERLSIAYGTRDRVLAPIELGAFAKVVALATIGIPTSLDQADTTDDIAILDQPSGNDVYLTLLRGSAQRTMLSYFDPRTTQTPAAQVDGFLDGVVVGRFHDATPSAVVVGYVTGPGTPGVTIWPMAIDPVAGLTPLLSAQGAPLQHVRECVAQSPPTPDLCLPNARYAVVPIAGDRDAILAIDRQAAPSAAHIAASGVAPVVTPTPQLTAMVPRGAAVRALHVVDLAGDGAHALLASFGPDGETRATGAVGLVEWCPLGADGIPTGACTDLGALLPGAPTCVDAAVGHVAAAGPTTADPGLALALVCYAGGTAGVYRMTRDAGGTFHGELVFGGLTAARGLELGDVTGDGVDDAIVLVGGPGAESLVVFPQCTSTEASAGGCS